ncbi:structural protein [Pseudomonas phage vB_PaeM_PA5oct]|uniref:Structural protein n=1 Tax=Pseudomonas phage vB_PaeM_PA5oct TaxID=2163605 RepID=A0A4Y5JXE6_9CAUD|nr:structural protein [Pseudomonas phage vB_PaeM_PA5oct]QCG76033.1 structural protein [Pseudomonas phage vB_PaeM_PA5oct]
MSHRKELEKVLDLLLNENAEQASALLHQIVVAKARDIYEQESADFEEDFVNEEVGGDSRESFIDDIKSDEEEIDADEMFDDQSSELNSEDEEEADADQDIEDKVEDLEAQLAALKAEFETLVSQEEDEPYHPNLEQDLNDAAADALEKFESLEEATKFSDSVNVDMKQEGKLAGTGNKSKTGSVDKESPFSKPTQKKNYGVDPVKFAKSTNQGAEASKKADESCDLNTEATPEKVSDPAMKQEGKLAGTGNKSKTGSVDKESPLSKAPKK